MAQTLIVILLVQVQVQAQKQSTHARHERAGRTPLKRETPEKRSKEALSTAPYRGSLNFSNSHYTTPHLHD